MTTLLMALCLVEEGTRQDLGQLWVPSLFGFNHNMGNDVQITFFLVRF